MTAATGTASLVGDKRIAIVGGGPAGLMLARLLQMRGAGVEVFEADAAQDSRNQGGSLDLHEDSGQLAMRRAGLEDQFRSISRPEGQASKVFDKYGRLCVDLRAEDEYQVCPEIDRGALHRLLLEALKPGTVTWGSRLLHAEPDSGRFQLTFQNGHRAVADLLFGCDGAWSKVRPLVSPSQPHYSGVTFIETRLSSPDADHPEVARLVGPGNVMAVGDNKALMAQRNGNGDIRVYVALRVPQAWTRHCGLDFGRLAEARAGLLKLFSGWSPRLRAMLEEADDCFVPRPLFTFPPQQIWRSLPNATLLGDAAHVMPPFTGKGANYAMLDAAELADNLTSGCFTDLTAAIRDYEATMLTRMKLAIGETLASQDLMIAPDAPAGLSALVEQRMKRQG